MTSVTLLLTLLIAALAASEVSSQTAVAGRILEPPVPALCAKRRIHEKFNGQNYFFSWKEPSTKDRQEDWLGARNFCRQRCMDLVSPDTMAKNEFVKRRIVEGNVKYIWTSGRLCDFEGCNRKDLQPLSVNGWFWTALLKKLPPTTNRAQNDWSHTGGIGRPQPDNREGVMGGDNEHCLAILNQFYKDGVHWHDVACHHFKSWVCEDNDMLIKYVQYNNPNLHIPS